MTTEKITGTKTFGAALAAGEVRFVASIANVAGVSIDDALHIFAYLHRARLVKRSGTDWHVKHGAYMEREPLLRALGFERSRLANPAVCDD